MAEYNMIIKITSEAEENKIKYSSDKNEERFKREIKIPIGMKSGLLKYDKNKNCNTFFIYICNVIVK